MMTCRNLSRNLGLWIWAGALILTSHVHASTFWSFQKPVQPETPKVKNTKWAKTDIDKFILAQLEAKKLKPAAPADKRTLIRRAAFDLTGLPPTPQEVENFLKDKSPNAFARVVDRLLASPQYGERWGRHWLDVVRYADSLDARSLGSEGDIGLAWRYRDWVVNSFNRDLPYDQFIQQQIAGDLLPGDYDTNRIVATGMYAIGNWGNGDADKDKILTDIADDAVDVTSRGFLGITMACARCHDHKFDPITTADYYSMAGFFFSSHILAKLTPKGAGENIIRIPLASTAELARRSEREAKMTNLTAQIEKVTDGEIVAMAKTLLPETARYLMAAAEFKNRPAMMAGIGPVEFAGRLNGGEASEEAAQVNSNVAGTSHAAADRNVRTPVTGALLKSWSDYLGFGDAKLMNHLAKDLLGKRGLHALRNGKDADTPSVVANTTAEEISFLSIRLPGKNLALHPSPTAGVAAEWRSPVSGKVRIKGRVADADPNCGDGIAWTIDLRHAGVIKGLASGEIPNGGAQDFKEGKNAERLAEIVVEDGDMLQVVILPKAEYSCDTTVVEFEITELDGAKRTWNLSKDVLPLIENKVAPFADSFGNPSVWYFYDLADQPTTIAGATNSPLAQWMQLVARKAPATETESVAAQIQALLLKEVPTNSPLRQLSDDLKNPRSKFWSYMRSDENNFSATTREKLTGLNDELATLKKNEPPPLLMAHAMVDGGTPESPHAGMHDVKIHIRGKYDRLGDIAPRGFPKVITAANPVIATNTSGRLELAKWIASPENPLTARVMVNRIWQHHFGEGIVRTPNNFGKLGLPPTHPELLDYLACEFVKSGWSIKALHRAIMLSAVYQQSSSPDPATLKADPDNLMFGHFNRQRLEAEALRDSLLAAAGKLDLTISGPSTNSLNSNRRTLYLTTIRSDRANYQALFDVADSTAIVEKRLNSTVSPQALFMLNNPFVLAQCKSLAERAQKEGPKETGKKVDWLYRLLYARPATSEEIKIALKVLSKAANGRWGEATDEPGLWQQYCQVLLCANEFIYVD